MKVLVLGTDNTILNPDSKTAKRAVEYGELVERYIVLVPADYDRTVRLSNKVEVIGITGKNKIKNYFALKKHAIYLIDNEKFDVISVQDIYFLGWLGIRLAKRYNIGVEIQIHGFEKFRLLRKFLARQVIKRANSLRVVSLRLAKLLVRKYDVDPMQLTQVPIFSDWIKWSNKKGDPTMREQFGNKAFIFITIGRFVPVKKIEMQLKAMAKLRKRLTKKSIKLIIIGEGPLEEKLKLLVKKLELTRSVFFISWVDADLVSYYQLADCMLLTSEKEGWGRVVVESLACRTPVIMTDVGCAGEILVNNVNGLVIPINDQEELNKAMESIVQNEVQYQKFVKNVHRYLDKLPNEEETLMLYRHSWEKARIVK